MSYISFFSFLWFTWLQVALFDVRFSNDSTFERLCKLLQLGVMTGMAVVAPSFSYSSEAGTEAFETLSLIIMVSRLILAAQYAVVLLWLRNYKKARLPMMGLVATEFITAMVSLGIFFAFRNGSGNAAGIGWNFMLVFEGVGMMSISGRVGFLNFRRTAIVERLGLLTLIILGEGIIGLTESIAKASGNGFDGFTPDIILQIISSVAILYFLWILYFDQIETERMSTLHQQWWIIVHFPYHVSVLLVVQGVAQLTVWRKLYNIFTSFYYTINVAPTDDLAECVRYINETFKVLYEQFPESDVAIPDISGELNAILGSQGNKTLIQEEELGVLVKGINWLADVFEVEIPERFVELEATNEAAGYYGVLATYTTVFLYFFICAGLVLILLAALFWLGNRHKTPGEWISIGVRGIIGVALGMLAIMGQSLLHYVQTASTDTNTTSPGGNYFRSEWMVPTVALVYFIGMFGAPFSPVPRLLLTTQVVITLDKILVYYVRSAVRKRQQLTKDIELDQLVQPAGR